MQVTSTAATAICRYGINETRDFIATSIAWGQIWCKLISARGFTRSDLVQNPRPADLHVLITILTFLNIYSVMLIGWEIIGNYIKKPRPFTLVLERSSVRLLATKKSCLISAALGIFCIKAVVKEKGPSSIKYEDSSF